MKSTGTSWSPLQMELARQIEEIALEEGWSQGKRIKTAELSRRFGVSRTPVTRALEYLAALGVVTHEPRRGFMLLEPIAAGGSRDESSEQEDLMTRIMRDRAFGRLHRDVSEAELTECYGVSRGEVRKVLQRLASDGLVTRSRGHGWHFEDSLDTDEAVDESYEFRLQVECAALRCPLFKADPAALSYLLQAHLSLMETPPEKISMETWFKLNAGFHEALAAWSGNRFYHQSMRQQNALRRLHEYAEFGSLVTDRIIQSSAEHVGILEAIKEGDLELAESLLRIHLLLARKMA